MTPKLTWAKVDYKTPPGVINAYWKLSGRKFGLDVRIPWGMAESIALPDGIGMEQQLIYLLAGPHKFSGN